MKTEHQQMSVRDLIHLYKKQMMKANPEYQRGSVWQKAQQKKLIDSVLRGYPLPKIYLHHVVDSVAGMTSERMEIIDGQQRINALYDFSEGAFKLFDPKLDDAVAKFPSFLKNQPCEWASKDFDGLSAELKERFLSTPISVSKIETDETNELRDLFIRLQGGVPLSAQERRDALPGKFTDYILKLGGKPQLARYPGHDFFVRTLGMKAGTDRGKARQLAAQIAALYFGRRKHGGDHFADINALSIDDFYYQNLDFDPNGEEAERLIKIFDKVSSVILPGKHAKLRGHDAIHLVLLVDTLWDDYVSSWEKSLPDALDNFLKNVAEAKLTKDDDKPDEYWIQYSQRTRVNSDRGETISKRNRFYLEKMLAAMPDLKTKDPNRLYGELERTILFYRQNKSCAVCNTETLWLDCEVHHVDEHSKGGLTTLENGAIVHRNCHPKGERQTKAFAERWHRRTGM